MSGIKEIRRRIRSVRNTGKITRAMEMISSIKMRKAADAVVSLRPYAETALRIFQDIIELRDTREELPFLVERPVRTALFIVLSSNRGLCGAFNAQILRRLRDEVALTAKEFPEGNIAFVSLGKKGDVRLRTFRGEIVASFPEAVAEASASQSRTVARFVTDGFATRRWDRVSLVYTDYVSGLVQTPHVRRILPLVGEEVARGIVGMGGVAGRRSVHTTPSFVETLVEPSPERVLPALVSRLVEIQILHALLESRASEEAARMSAMRNASDAAQEMAGDYTLLYNQIRQSKVTQEIAELSAGMAAVS